MVLALVLGLLGLAPASYAQLNPLGQAYFQNQYLANPAMAGLGEGLRVNAGYRQQWTSMPGSPSTQFLTGDYGFKNRVGLGANIYHEKAGLLHAQDKPPTIHLTFAVRVSSAISLFHFLRSKGQGFLPALQ